MILDRIERSAEVRDLLSLAVVEAGPITERTAPPEFDDELAASLGALRERHAGKTAGAIDHLQPARALYRAIGIDPTRHRPSPEALLRRVLRGEEFPRHHPAVDLANLWALLSGLPVGLYDRARLAGERIEVRLGREDEGYAGIAKPEIRLGGKLVLADALGPFGNPSSDSARTAVSNETRDCLFVMFAPAATDISALDRWAAWLRERAEAYLGGRAVSGVLP